MQGLLAIATTINSFDQVHNFIQLTISNLNRRIILRGMIGKNNNKKTQK